MTNRSARAATICVLLLPALGCGDDGAPSQGSGADPIDATPITQASYADAIADATCEAIEACECRELMAGAERPTYPNGEACRYEEALLFEAFVTEALDAGLEYDQTCAGEHRQRLEQHGCEWAWDLADDCNPCPVVHGDKPVGVACEIYERNPAYSDCARGLLCPNLRPDQAFGSPVCVQACPTPVAVGESCKGQAADSSRPLLCVDGAYCKAGVCTQGAGIGERCASERDCTSRASCSLAEEDVRVCTPKVALGKMCDLANRCLEGSCLNELDAEGNTTSARSCVGPGEPCGVNLIGEQGGLTCVDGASVEVAGVCSNDVTRQLFSRYPS